MPESSGVEIHARALVSPSAHVGAGSTVGPFAVVEDEVHLGRNCVVSAHAVIKTGCRMGDGNRVFEHAVLCGPPQDLAFKGGPVAVHLGNGNVFREGVTVHGSARADQPTRMGDGNFLMALTHVAHDCRLGNNNIIANNVCLAGHVEFEDSIFVSGGVVIHQFCRVGRHAMIGGNAKVIQDVLPYCLVDGVPAKCRGLNSVGLRRAGLHREELIALKKAYRILLADSSPLEGKLERLEALESARVGQIVEFIRRSERGFCRQ